MKYRIEYILVIPGMALVFGKYLAMAPRPASAAQRPEKLFAEKGLMAEILVRAPVFALCTVIKIPALEPLAYRHFITLGDGMSAPPWGVRPSRRSRAPTHGAAPPA